MYFFKKHLRNTLSKKTRVIVLDTNPQSVERLETQKRMLRNGNAATRRPQWSHWEKMNNSRLGSIWLAGAEKWSFKNTY